MIPSKTEVNIINFEWIKELYIGYTVWGKVCHSHYKLISQIHFWKTQKYTVRFEIKRFPFKIK